VIDGYGGKFKDVAGLLSRRNLPLDSCREHEPQTGDAWNRFPSQRREAKMVKYRQDLPLDAVCN
jgi:hypothetical protein